MDLGLSISAIRQRLVTGRLHRVHRGVYAVGLPDLTRLGELMAALLAAGDGAALSHETAAEVLGIAPAGRAIHVTVPPSRSPSPPGITIHRRPVPGDERGLCQGLSVTSPARTLCDLACHLPPAELERAVNEADKLDLIDPEALREALDRMTGLRGAPALRRLLDRHTFTLTDSELERAFNPIARAAGLPLPDAEKRVTGFRVDFYWRDLGLVVETDGLRYHRTPSQQAAALKRDQAHFRAGLTPLRFSHAQVAYEAEYVRDALEDMARRLDR